MDLVDLMYPSTSTLQDLPSKYDTAALVDRVKEEVGKCDPKREGAVSMAEGVMKKVNEVMAVLGARAR